MMRVAATEAADDSTSADLPSPPSTDVAPRRRRAMRRWLTTRRVSGILLALLVLGAAYVAVNLHRRGHTIGDDFALYVRMSKSLFEGNIADVISDNRFLFDHSTSVTPPIYPWGWPLLLAPFVRVWGLDFDRLKLVEVGVFAAWLVLYHGIARRRAGRIVAFAVTAVFATSYTYLVYTDQLLTEYPHMLAVAVVIWWLDRVMDRSRLTFAPTRDLVILGLLVVVAYNVRREGLMLLFAIAAAQLVDVAATRSGRATIRALPWKKLATPHLAFAAGALVAQLALPSTLVPDNGNSARFIPTRLWSLDNQPTGSRRAQYPANLVAQLGLREPAVFGRWLMVLAVIGAAIACVRSPRKNVPLAVLVVTTMLVIGTHLRMVSRYYMQVTPFIVLFVAMLLLYVVTWIAQLLASPRKLGLRAGRVAAVVAAVPFLWLAVYHATDLPRRVDAAAAFNDSGEVQRGPDTEESQTAMEAIDKYVPPQDVVVYYRARTATLYTGRRALQTTSFNNMATYGDWFMQNKTDDYSQVDVTWQQLDAAGFELVWQNDDWRLWRIPEGPVELTAGSTDVQPPFDSATVGGSPP